MIAELHTSLEGYVRQQQESANQCSLEQLVNELRALSACAESLAREVECMPNRGAAIATREGVALDECRTSLNRVLSDDLRRNRQSSPASVLYRGVAERYLGLRHLGRSERFDKAFWRHVARGLTGGTCSTLPQLAEYLSSMEEPSSARCEITEADRAAVREFLMDALLDVMESNPGLAAIFTILLDLKVEEGLPLTLAEHLYAAACHERPVKCYKLLSFINSGSFRGSFATRRESRGLILTLTPVGANIALRLRNRASRTSN
ncbi:MAG: hypothetical protein IT290_09540 [Deltaproteobacteria bacterium]|nr:hypothetical protein [Deltaproteobacteria bacterium]